MYTNLRILIVAEHASAFFGGEAALPLHYFRIFEKHGVPVWLITHSRTRAELEKLFPQAAGRILYVEDNAVHRAMWKLGRFLPDRLSYFTTGFVSRLTTQWVQRRLARRLVRQEAIDVVHQPMPVSPREPSVLYGLGAPVVIGPMNGGIDYPPAFRKAQSPVVSTLLQVGRRASSLLNRLMPGKRHAAALLVANRRTRLALPDGVCAQVVEMVENGVDLALWNPACRVEEGGTSSECSSFPIRFVFIGRLVDWKAVHLIVHAFSRLVAAMQRQGAGSASLSILGDGAERPALELLARNLGILAATEGEAGKIYFHGWQSQPNCATHLGKSHVLLLPSLMECGGAVVLEAMSMGLPVIATDWGGPADYLDEECGILIAPTSEQAMIEGFTKGMLRLARSPEERGRMGAAGRAKVEVLYDWEIKARKMAEIYRAVVAEKKMLSIA